MTDRPTFLPAQTIPQRLAAEELLSGPLYRNGNVFQRPGGTRVVQLQPVRGLLEQRLATFDTNSQAVLPSRKLFYEAERAGLLEPTGAPQP